jgi:hypothetical protein
MGGRARERETNVPGFGPVEGFCYVVVAFAVAAHCAGQGGRRRAVGDGTD